MKKYYYEGYKSAVKRKPRRSKPPSGMVQAGPVIRLNAGNDVNGNPRRVFIQLSSKGLILDAWDEDYLGESAIPSDHRASYSGLTLFVTPGTYRDVIKNYTKKR